MPMPMPAMPACPSSVFLPTILKMKEFGRNVDTRGGEKRDAGGEVRGLEGRRGIQKEKGHEV